MSFQYSAASTVLIWASAESLFDHLDDHRRLAEHMSRRSKLMLGGRMSYEDD